MVPKDRKPYSCPSILKKAKSYERWAKMIYAPVLDQIVNKPVLFIGPHNNSSQRCRSSSNSGVQLLNFSLTPISTGSSDKLQAAFLARIIHNNFTSFISVKADINADDLDVITGELACQSSVVPSKLYGGFLKFALTTQVHLKATLKRTPYIPATNIKAVVAPSFKPRGLSCVVYGMNIVDKKVKALQTTCLFNYSSTQREFKSSAIKSLLDGFALVETMIKNIKAMIIEYSRTPNHTMPNIKNKRKKNVNVKMSDIDQYISPVSTRPNSGNVEEDDEQEDEGVYDEFYKRNTVWWHLRAEARYMNTLGYPLYQ